MIDLSSEERGPCDFGSSSQSITYIVAHIIALVLLTIVCIIISQLCINKEKRYVSESNICDLSVNSIDFRFWIATKNLGLQFC